MTVNTFQKIFSYVALAVRKCYWNNYSANAMCDVYYCTNYVYCIYTNPPLIRVGKT